MIKYSTLLSSIIVGTSTLFAMDTPINCDLDVPASVSFLEKENIPETMKYLERKIAYHRLNNNCPSDSGCDAEDLKVDSSDDENNNTLFKCTYFGSWAKKPYDSESDSDDEESEGYSSSDDEDEEITD